MRIRLFESFQELHTVNIEDIEDYGQELVDEGFTLTIRKRFFSDDRKTDEPIATNTRPYYQIDFSRIDRRREKSLWRYDGSFYSEDIRILGMFNQFVKRMTRWGTPYWWISNGSFRCELWLDQVETRETGFDWRDFVEKFRSEIEDINFETPIRLTRGFAHGDSLEWGFVVESDIPEKRIKDFLNRYDKFIKWKVVPKKGRYKTLLVSVKKIDK